MSDTDLARAVLAALGTKLDGKAAAPATTQRKRGVFVNAIEYAIERRLLMTNPVPATKKKAGKTGKPVDKRVVANPTQARSLLAAVREQGKTGKMLEGFFGTMYYAGLRPGEAVNLRKHNVVLPPLVLNKKTGEWEEPEDAWGELVLEQSAPATGAAWTNNGRRREVRQLKGRDVGEQRPVPCPPELTKLLRLHIKNHGVDAEGRLFRGIQNGTEVPEGTYC